MQNLPFHPHYDVWALIFSLIIFFEYSTNNKAIKQEKRKVWYSGVGFLWLFTDYPIHDIGEKYLFFSSFFRTSCSSTCFTSTFASWNAQRHEKANIY